MDCRCDTVTELYGEEAAAYAAEHLHASPAVDELVCPDTGARWRLEESDPEQPRLVAAGERSSPGRSESMSESRRRPFR